MCLPVLVGPRGNSLRILQRFNLKNNPARSSGPERDDLVRRALLNCCPSSCKEVPDDRDHGKNQQQVDQTAGDMKRQESQDP